MSDQVPRNEAQTAMDERVRIWLEARDRLIEKLRRRDRATQARKNKQSKENQSENGDNA